MHAKLTEADVALVLRASPNPEVQKEAQNAAMLASMLRILNASLEIAAAGNGTPYGIAMAFNKKGLEINKVVAGATDSNILKVVSATGGVAMANTALKVAGSMSPGRALTVAGFVAVDKLMTLGGLQNKHKCELAIGSFLTTGGLTVASLSTAPVTLGIPTIVGAISVLAAGIDAYGACKGER